MVKRPGLTDKEQEAMDLRGQGLSLKKIADILEISSSAVRGRLVTARRYLDHPERYQNRKYYNEGPYIPDEFDINTTACIIGNTPGEIYGRKRNPSGLVSKIYASLRAEIKAAIMKGYRTIIVVARQGAGHYAANVLLQYKRKEDVEIDLVSIIPYRGIEEPWGNDKATLELFTDYAKKTICFGEQDTPDTISKAYQAAIDCSSLLIAVFNGLPGETANAINYAKSRGSTVFCIDTPLSLSQEGAASE